jgi:hypothetical protein
MSTTPLLSRCAILCAVALAAACGGSSNEPDAYNGVIDGAGLDLKFVAVAASTSSVSTACKSGGACYPDQRGYANGKELHFYNMGSTRTSYLPNPIPVSVADHKPDGNGGAHVDNFPNSCTPGRAFNSRTDAYPTARQAPIFDELPLATTTYNATVWPVIALYGVTGVSGETCNDLKDSRSIANANDEEAGSFGARRSATPNGYQLWPVISPTALVPTLTGAIDTSFGAQLGWFRGLQLKYLNGGPIPTARLQDPAFPTDPSKLIEALVPMEGVIVNTPTSFSAPTADQVVIFPAVPGTEAWSPIARLHNYKSKGEALGTFKGLCGSKAGTTWSTGRNCVPGLLDINDSNVEASSYYTLFVVSTPQP